MFWLLPAAAILADVGQLGVVLLGWVQDNIGFGLDLLKAVTKPRATFADTQVQAFFVCNFTASWSNYRVCIHISCMHCGSLVCRGRLSHHCDARHLIDFVYVMQINVMWIHKGVHSYRTLHVSPAVGKPFMFFAA